MNFETSNKNPVITYRKKRDLKPAQLAKLVGVSANTIYRLEKGYQASLPSQIRRTLNEAEDGLGDDLAEAYGEWREKEKEEILSSQESDS
mgnify:CR=1 FL=1